MVSSLIYNLLNDPRVLVLRKAFHQSCDLFLVGGCVRDLFLGKTTEDIDITCELSPNEITEIAEKNGLRVIPTGLRHQTVTILTHEDSNPIEITTFHGPNMRPIGGVSKGITIEEDLSYRDFTINAMAISINNSTLIDPTRGQKDIELKLIRTVNNPKERFIEDPLRLMRMVRFACLDGFSVDQSTLLAACDSNDLLRNVSIERIREEFTKIIISSRPTFGLKMLAELKLLEVFLPELQACVGFEQNKFHYHDVFEHTLEVVEKTPQDIILRLGAIFHDIGKPPTLSVDESGERHFYKHEIEGALITKNCLERMRYPLNIVNAVEILVRTHMRPLNAGAGGLRRLLRDTGELFPKWRALKEADSLSTRVEHEKTLSELKEFDQTMEIVKKGQDVSPLKNLAINGDDIIAIGVPQSKRIGELLQILHEHVLDNPEDNQKAILFEKLKKLI